MDKKDVFVYTLDNGIRCLLQKVNSNVIYSSMTINSGSSKETKPSLYGVAHFLEHLLFKGTEKRDAFEITRMIEERGGELNAYTSKEETVIHSTVIKRDFERAVDVIADVIFFSVFPQEEIEKERAVILDEINSYSDSPSELIFDDFENRIFTDKGLGHPILGTKRSVNAIKKEHLEQFVRENYTTDKMIFAVSGDVSQIEFTDLCDKYLGIIPRREGVNSLQKDLKKSKEGDVTYFFDEINKKTFQCHCVLGSLAPSLKHSSQSERLAFTLLMNALGGPAMSSILNWTIREKLGLCYQIEGNYSVYENVGLYNIYFGGTKENLDKTLEIINKEIGKIQNVEFDSNKVEEIKWQFKSQIMIGAENRESQILSLAKALFYNKKIESIDSIIKRVDKISGVELLEIANRYLTKDNSILVYK